MTCVDFFRVSKKKQCINISGTYSSLLLKTLNIFKSLNLKKKKIVLIAQMVMVTQLCINTIKS